jgi:hypothetical protein
MATPSHYLGERLRRRTQAFLACWNLHERGENLLIQEAYLRDIGTAD